MAVLLTFDPEVQLLRSIYQKNCQAMGIVVEHYSVLPYKACSGESILFPFLKGQIKLQIISSTRDGRVYVPYLLYVYN